MTKVLDLLTPRERRQATLLVPLVALMALAEVAGIASIAPFLSLIADPESVRTNPFLAWAFETFAFDSEQAFLFAVGIGVLVALVASNVLLTSGYWILYRFGSLRNHSISMRLLEKYLRQPYRFFLTHNSSALANNVLQEVFQIINGIVLPGLQAFAKGVAALAIVVLLIFIDPMLAALVTGLLGGAYALLFLTTRRYLSRIGKARVTSNQARYQAANEAMGGIKELKLMGREEEMLRRFSGPSLRFATYQANSRIIATIPRYGLEAVAFGSLVIIVLVLLASDRALAQVLPVLGLYAFAGYRLLPALQIVFSGVSQIRYSRGALDEVHRMVHETSDDAPDVRSDDRRGSATSRPFDRDIRFRSVSFGYDDASPVLDGMDLRIEARTTVAFVGPTGAGKSTVVDLMLGLLEPTEGRIEIDGRPLDKESRPWWQSQIGYVPQSIFLTDDSIRRNIALGVPDAQIDDDAVERAARMARVHDFIVTELPNEYDTTVGERGVRLSGGQRQRIGLARALYADPEILVLDEATSALDGATERAVFDAIRHLSGEKTIIMIAHRIDTVRACDEIHVLEAGRVVASGPFDDLYRRSDLFRTLADGSSDAHGGRSTPASE